MRQGPEAYAKAVLALSAPSSTISLPLSVLFELSRRRSVSLPSLSPPPPSSPRFCSRSSSFPNSLARLRSHAECALSGVSTRRGRRRCLHAMSSFFFFFREVEAMMLLADAMLSCVGVCQQVSGVVLIFVIAMLPYLEAFLLEAYPPFSEASRPFLEAVL